MMILLWLVLSAVVGVGAAYRGRNGVLWGLLSLVISPLIALVLLMVIPNLAGRPTPETHVRCPDCRELVLRDARKCKHCGTALVPQ